jgi:hypothetical protein
MDRHEVKDNPLIPLENDSRIVEAYGDRKYPKLVEQIAADVHEIRIKGDASSLARPLSLANIQLP